MASKAGSTKPDLEGLLLLEQPFARLPHEELRRQLRTHQRLVERDLTFCATTLADLAGKGDAGTSSPSKSNATAKSKAKTNEAAAVAAMRRAAAAAQQQQQQQQGGDTTMGGGESSQKSADAMSIDEASGAATPIAPDTDLQKTLDVMLGRLRGLKRKVSGASVTHPTSYS